ncbi:MAG: PAS domain S-box protein [Pseudomonadota bacterium]
MPVDFDGVNASELMRDLPEALFVMAPDGQILFVNPALTALAGYEAADLVGQHVRQLMPAQARRRVDVVAWLQRWAVDPNPAQLRFLKLELLTGAGDTRLVNVRVSRHNRADSPYFLVLLRDVTEEHESNAELRHTQLVTSRILAIGADAVLCLGADHRITYWNQAAEKLFGYERVDAIGQPLSLILPEGLVDQHDHWIRQFERSAEATRLMGERAEVRGRTRDGRILPLEISITKTTVEGSIILGAQIRDISDRKRSEEAVRASEARFRAIFEHAVEAMALLDPTGRVVELNAAGHAMLPVFDDNRMLWELDWWGGASADAARDSLRLAVTAAGRGERIAARVVLGPNTGQGTREIDFSLIPVIGPDGNPDWIIAEGRDITPVA